MIAVIKRHPISSRIVEQLSAEDLAAFRDTRLGEVRPATVLRQLRVILHTLKVASDEWGWVVPLTEVRKVRLPRVLVRHTDRVTDQEFSKFLSFANECCRGELAFVARLALSTAMRRGELLALDWSDIELEQRFALVRMSKNGHARKVPLSRAAIETLSEKLCRQGPVIKLSANAVKLAFARVRKQAGTTFRFHDLRHEAISRLFELGLTVPEAQLVSGHRTMSQLSRYAHADVERIAGKLAV
jgi:integrase